jgi:hypothetical protein
MSFCVPALEQRILNLVDRGAVCTHVYAWTMVPRRTLAAGPCVVAHKTAVPPPRNVTNETYFGTIVPQIVAVVDRSR